MLFRNISIYIELQFHTFYHAPNKGITTGRYKLDTHQTGIGFSYYLFFIEIWNILEAVATEFDPASYDCWQWKWKQDFQNCTSASPSSQLPTWSFQRFWNPWHEGSCFWVQRFSWSSVWSWSKVKGRSSWLRDMSIVSIWSKWLKG